MTVDTPAPIADDDALRAMREQAAGGSPGAQFDLACGLVARDRLEEGLEMYRRAAQNGHPGAQVEYARMLLWGVACDPSPSAAVGWLERAEAAGVVEAGYYLALLALGSVVLPRDMRTINERVLAAVRASFPPALRAAAVHLGRRDNPVDQMRCVRLLDRATSLGDPVSARLLVERLMRGEGCDVQPRAARQLRSQLAALGHPGLPPITAPRPATGRHTAPAEAIDAASLALEDALQPAAVRTLSQDPCILQVDGLLSADECRLLVASAQPLLRRSRTVDPRTGEPTTVELRTSSDASFDPMLEDLALRLVQLRMARAARMELSHAEQLIVLRYQPGEEYRPHRDYLSAAAQGQNQPQAGNRARTLCVYLNNVEAGGDTDFPLVGVRVAPRAGSAVVFDNLRSDGQPDERTLHAGMPVAQGEKWLATLWLRQRRYRRY